MKWQFVDLLFQNEILSIVVVILKSSLLRDSGIDLCIKFLICPSHKKMQFLHNTICHDYFCNYEVELFHLFFFWKWKDFLRMYKIKRKRKLKRNVKGTKNKLPGICERTKFIWSIAYKPRKGLVRNIGLHCLHTKETFHTNTIRTSLSWMNEWILSLSPSYNIQKLH